ncbi:MAG: DUF5723 family protein, partial [Prevotellaceae bacterium]|nr:DUF5723 family protein [Prevotellaceae bacterium]
MRIIYGLAKVFWSVEICPRTMCAPLAALSLAAALLPYSRAQAQHNATMYFMRDLPAVNSLNPAFHPEAGSIYVGFPLISSTYVDAGITLKGMNIGNILSNRPQVSSAAANPSFRESGYANVDVNLLNVGAFVHGMYFTLDVTEKTRFEAAFPSDLVKLAWHGNAPYVGQIMSIDGLGAYLSSYAEVALGATKEVVRNRIVVGGKVKRLMGVGFADLNMGRGAFISTDAETWSTTVGIAPEASIAGISSNIPSGGAFDYDTINNSFEFKGFSGGGWGIDAGFEIKSERFSVSGSIVNLGGIRWSAKQVALQKGSLIRSFYGVQNNGETNNITDIIDSLKRETFWGRSKKTLQWMSPTLTIGVAYHLNGHFDIGALAGITTSRYNSYPLLALSLNTRRYPINGSISYSYAHSHNLGMGVVLGRRDMQLHFICDNILAASYHTAQKISIRAGLSL